VVVACGVIENRFKIDDPVGAIAVHGVNGAFGVLSVGLFANGQYGAAWNGTLEGTAATEKGISGLFYGVDPGLGQLGAQAVGVLTICTVMFLLVFLFFKIQNAIMKGGIRPSAEMEIEGMDIPEMGALAYPDFIEQEAITLHAGTSPTHEVPTPV
jgi:Amt family ammonium transporter